MSGIAITNEVFVSCGETKSRAFGQRLAHAVDIFIFSALLALMVLVAIPYGTVEPWLISLYECAVFALAVLWIVQGMISGTWAVTERELLVPLAALIVFAFCQTVAWPGMSGKVSSADPFETRLTALKFFALAVNGALLMRYTYNSRRLSLLIHAVIAIAALSALFGILRATIQQTDYGFGLPLLLRNSGFAQFVNKNHFAFMIEMAIGLLLGLLVGRAIKRKYLLLYISVAVWMLIALVMTISRGGILSTVAQILFIFGGCAWLRSSIDELSRRLRCTIAGVALATIVVIAGAASAIWMEGDLLMTRMNSLTTEVDDQRGLPLDGVRRWEVWGATTKLAMTHPIMGSGFGAYGIAITPFHNGSGAWIPEAAHNDYLELIASGGLVGTLIFGWFSFVFFKRAQGQLMSLDSDRRAASLGAVTGILGIGIHSMVDFGLHITANAVVFLALLVIAARETGRTTANS